MFSGSFKEHVEHVCKVLQRLYQHGVKLNPEKCMIFQEEVKYLGHIIKPDGYKMDLDNVAAVQKLASDHPPSTVGQLLQLYAMRHFFIRLISLDYLITFLYSFITFPHIFRIWIFFHFDLEFMVHFGL